MASFSEPFNNLSAWDFGTSPLTEFFVASSTPAPYGGSSRASARHYVDDWGAARFDIDDGGVPGTLYWMSYAFYMGTWAEVSGTGFGNIALPGFINLNDDPIKGLNGTDGVWAYQPFLNPSGPGGVISSPFGGGNGPSGQVSENGWHTVRYALRLDGVNSREVLYLDDVLQWDDTFNSGDSNGVAGVFVGGFQDVDSYTLPIDTLMYSAAADPGEPVESTFGPLCESEGVMMRVVLDDVDITEVSVSGSWTPRLNRPAQATVTVPMELASGDAGSRLKLYLTNGSDETLVFHGFVLNIETTADKDGGRTVYNAQDPMELWQWRPVRDDGADFSKPDIISAYLSGPQILEAMLINTEDSTGRTNTELETGGPPPTDAEGPIFLDLGTFEGGGVDLSGAPVDWPMTIAELFALLVSTGRLDAVITPTDPGGGVMGTIDAYNGDYGQDLSNDILFSYGMGAHNVSALRWNRDMTNMINKYWLYGGPRIQTAGDPAGDQHWCFNVQGFDQGLAYPPGGQAVDENNDPFGPPWTDNQLGERVYDSRTTYGVRMKVDIFDAYDEDCVLGVGTPGRDLYRYQWQVYSWFSAIPREIIHVTPLPDTYIGCFGVGDLVGIEAVSHVRGGFSGAQRVYEFTISWEGTPSVLTMSELQVSSDAEGMS